MTPPGVGRTELDERRPATVVLVHGAWHGPWCWRHVVDGLESAGVRSVAVSLPSVDPAQEGGLTADAGAVREAIEGVGGPVVLCGHSYGGTVITEVGDHPAVRHLVYLTAFASDRGETLLSLATSDVARSAHEESLVPAIQFVDDGKRMALDLELAVPLLYAQSPRKDVDLVLAHVASHAASSFETPTSCVAWRSKPSTYVVCARDRTLPPALQRFLAKRCTRTIELDTDHSPFFSMPEETTRILRELANA